MRLGQASRDRTADEAVDETRKNIQMYSEAVAHLTGIYAANPSTARVWEPLQKILKDGAKMRSRLLSFVSQWCAATGVLVGGLQRVMACGAGKQIDEFDRFDEL